MKLPEIVQKTCSCYGQVEWRIMRKTGSTWKKIMHWAKLQGMHVYPNMCLSLPSSSCSSFHQTLIPKEPEQLKQTQGYPNTKVLFQTFKPNIQELSWLPVTGTILNKACLLQGCICTSRKFDSLTAASERSFHRQIQQGSLGDQPHSQYSQDHKIPTDKETSKKEQPPHPRLLEGLQRLKAIEDNLRFQGYSVLRWGLGLIVVVGTFIYIFREYIRSTVADEVSHVASRSLGDQMVQVRAKQLSIALLNAILSDVNIQRQAVAFLEDIISKEQTKEAASNLVQSVVSDPAVQAQISTVTKKIIVEAFSDQEFRNQVASHIVTILQHQEVEKTVIQLVLRALRNKQVQEGAKGLAVDVIQSPQVRAETVALGKTLVGEVVKDPSVQQLTGDGLYRAFVHSITPGIFSRHRQQPDKPTTQESDKVEASRDASDSGSATGGA